MTDHRHTVRAYWASAEARDWDTFATLLAETVRYEMPQTGERITGRGTYLRFNREYPGDWHIVPLDVLVDGERAVSRVECTLDGGTQQAVSFFEFDDAGLISRVVDFWPEPYEPPAGREHLVDRD